MPPSSRAHRASGVVDDRATYARRADGVEAVRAQAVPASVRVSLRFAQSSLFAVQLLEARLPSSLANAVDGPGAMSREKLKNEDHSLPLPNRPGCVGLTIELGGRKA